VKELHPATVLCSLFQQKLHNFKVLIYGLSTVSSFGENKKYKQLLNIVSQKGQMCGQCMDGEIMVTTCMMQEIPVVLRAKA
jgi:aerobic-type carbon monoxide dehydrogenase small subunit (CoxS/CutS family)